MMNEILLKKIQNEEALTADEQAALDLALDTEGGAVHACMTGLIDEEPSMAWRSGLNERLIALRPAPTPSKSAELDVQLESDAQLQTAAWVQNLGDEEPQMTWRSQLNEKLHALRGPVRRKPIWQTWRLASAGAVAVAGAIALVVMMNGPKSKPTPAPVAQRPSSIEAGLIAAHQESAGALDLGSNTRMPALENKSSSSSMWTDADLETL
ncbi:MAG: hypothetical protein K1X67_08645 [Fimbriimonadaceae bacterium]|nr:hypothetical protein [Fimbriimonadaceae bacterium]